MNILIEVLESLIKLSPLVASLCGFIFYLYKKNEKQEAVCIGKDNEIKELNLYIRKNDKDNQQILGQVATTLDKVLDDQKHSVEEIKNHISILVMLKNKSNDNG